LAAGTPVIGAECEFLIVVGHAAAGGGYEDVDAAEVEGTADDRRQIRHPQRAKQSFRTGVTTRPCRRFPYRNDRASTGRERYRKRDPEGREFPSLASCLTGKIVDDCTSGTSLGAVWWLRTDRASLLTMLLDTRSLDATINLMRGEVEKKSPSNDCAAEPEAGEAARQGDG
ncbi:hypothetical protein THAOC_29739, partial [Thalassiosira oceanica]